MLKHGYVEPSFKGSMVDSAQANWNVVKINYGSKDVVVKMVDKEGTCLFHWIQSLNRHNKQLITPKLKDQQNALCFKLKKFKSLKEVDIQYVIICC
jgi:hypothetical protein